MGPLNYVETLRLDLVRCEAALARATATSRQSLEAQRDRILKKLSKEKQS